MNSYVLSEDKAQNREVLKQFLRDHATQFDMREWFGDLYFLENVRKKTANPNLSPIEAFELCKTPCWIGGGCEILTNQKSQALSKFFEDGGSNIVYEYYWPPSLEFDYNAAKAQGDFTQMVEAACKAIDFFGENPEYARESEDSPELDDDYDYEDDDDELEDDE